jgi:hypothetical protein
MQAAMIAQTADEEMVKFRKEVSRLLDTVNKEENMQPAAQQSYLKEAERLGDIYIAIEKCALVTCAHPCRNQFVRSFSSSD